MPERREELTTEGGLDVVGQQRRGSPRRSAAAATRASRSRSFIDPDPPQVEAALGIGVDAVELHTGRYADAPRAGRGRRSSRPCGRRRATDRRARHGSLHAGHGLNYRNVSPVARLDRMAELNIGHSIVSRAVFVGMERCPRDEGLHGRSGRLACLSESEPRNAPAPHVQECCRLDFQAFF